jgi:DedD protein
MTEASRKEAPKDERRSLLLRAAVAVAIIAVMLIGLSLWDRSRNREREEAVPTATPPTPASGIHSIGTTTPKPAAEPEIVESAPVETVQSAPATGESEVAEEAVEAVPRPGKAVAPPREAASAPAARAEAPPKAEPARPETPQPVLQTESVPPGDRPPAGKAFALQVGVFSNPANAEDLRAKLVLAGIPAQIETRVQVGPFKSREEVAAAQAKLKALGMERGKLVLVKP